MSYCLVFEKISRSRSNMNVTTLYIIIHNLVGGNLNIINILTNKQTCLISSVYIVKAFIQNTIKQPSPAVYFIESNFSFCAEGHRKLLTNVFISSSSSILVEYKETNQFAVIQFRGLFDCTGVNSSLYTVDCTHVLQQPGMNSFSYVLVQG